MIKKFTLIKAVFFAATVGFLFLSSSSGRNDRRAGAPGDGLCSDCHSGGSTDGFVLLNNVPTEITPNTTYNMDLQVNDGDAIYAGFQLVATNGSNGDMVGSFSVVPGSVTRIVTVGSGTGRLVHLNPKPFSGGTVSWDIEWTSPANPPADITFHYAGNAADQSGGTSGDAIYAGQSGAVPLPVELLYFDAKADDQSVELRWATASERENAFFAIERSLDGGSFEEIGRVDGVGFSNVQQAYVFEDQFPAGGDNYYRLRQVDEDGAEMFSKVEVVSLESRPGIQWALYPNPAADQIHFRQKGEFQENILIEVFNAQGTLLERRLISDLEIRLSIQDYPVGMYFMRWQANGASGSERFVKK